MAENETVDNETTNEETVSAESVSAESVSAESVNEDVIAETHADGVEGTPETPADETAHDALPDAPIEGVEGGQTDDYATNAAPTSSREFNVQGELVDALSDGDAGGDEREVENGRSYEVVFISRVNDAEATENTTQRLREMVEQSGGAIDNVRNSETRRLAYPIRGEIEGVYVVINTRFAPQNMGEIDRFFKLQENVIRHMILRLED